MLTDADVSRKLKSGALQVDIRVVEIPENVLLIVQAKRALAFNKIFIQFTSWDQSTASICEDEAEVTVHEHLNLLLAIYSSEHPIDSLETIRLMYLHGFMSSEQIIYRGMLFTKIDLMQSVSLAVPLCTDLLN